MTKPVDPVKKNNINGEHKIFTSERIRFISGIIVIFLIGYIFNYLIGLNLGVPLLLISLFSYVKIAQKHSGFNNGSNLLDFVLLYVLLFFAGHFVVSRGYPVFYIPFCAITMLSVVLFNELKKSLLLAVAGAMSCASLAGNNLNLGLLFLISGILSIILVFGARRRGAIMRTGIIIGLIQAASVFLIEGFYAKHPDRYLVLILNGIISSIIVIGVLPIFEYLFKTVTNISLLELADFNHPLLQRLTLEAPGTYHHSLIVGNLSDAACQAVGANALLARIGAYYHDIGKLSKPEYFSENQGLQINKHDALSPTMSKLVIMNHVKEGVELAKKYRLNPRLIDFIQEHHGNSLVFYFYRRALENSDKDQQIEEEGFRYAGPKPKTKEAAIILLADSVEAATRTLKEPNPANTEETVHKIINNKFIDGQLDECDLTLKELEKIAAVFKRILSGIYHNRVIYPENPKSETR